MAIRFDDIEQLPERFRAQAQAQINAQNKRKGINIPPETKNAPDPDITPQRKYHNTPTERLLPNGECIKFRSKKEANYYDKLMLMEKAGQVRKIRLERQYLLKPGYTDPHTGERLRAVYYLADFVYEKLDDNGEWKEHIIDTKGGKKNGTRTKEYTIKRKLMAEMGYNVEEA